MSQIIPRHLSHEEINSLSGIYYDKRKIQEIVEKVRTESNRRNLSKVNAIIEHAKILSGSIADPKSLAFLYQKKIEALCFLNFEENYEKITSLSKSLKQLRDRFPHDADINAIYWISESIFYNRGTKNFKSTSPLFVRLEFSQIANPISQNGFEENLTKDVNECSRNLELYLYQVQEKELQAEILYTLGINMLISPITRLQADSYFNRSGKVYAEIDSLTGKITSLILEGLSSALAGSYPNSAKHFKVAEQLIKDCNALHKCPLIKAFLLVSEMEALYYFFKNPKMLSSLDVPIQPSVILAVIQNIYKESKDVLDCFNPTSEKDTDYSWWLLENQGRMEFIKQDIQAHN